LNRRQQQRHKNANDGNHHEQLDQCESVPPTFHRFPGQKNRIQTERVA
jgi:hypothetical protein